MGQPTALVSQLPSKTAREPARHLLGWRPGDCVSSGGRGNEGAGLYRRGGIGFGCAAQVACQGLRESSEPRGAGCVVAGRGIACADQRLKILPQPGHGAIARRHASGRCCPEPRTRCRRRPRVHNLELRAMRRRAAVVITIAVLRPSDRRALSRWARRYIPGPVGADSRDAYRKFLQPLPQSGAFPRPVGPTSSAVASDCFDRRTVAITACWGAAMR